jgi:hypothetical protein
VSDLHPERAPARSAIVFAAIVRPILILAMVVVILALIGYHTGAVRIPALDAVR